MADYYPLIARAVAGLDKNTGENRRALYERARTALVAQLRGVEPPLDESEITQERLALEEAIRKIEAEASRQARETGRAASQATRPQTPQAQTPPVPAPPAPTSPAPTPPAPRRPEPQRPPAAPYEPPTRRPVPPPPSSPSAPSRAARTAERGGTPNASLSDEAIRTYRDRDPAGLDQAPDQPDGGPDHAPQSPAPKPPASLRSSLKTGPMPPKRPNERPVERSGEQQAEPPMAPRPAGPGAAPPGSQRPGHQGPTPQGSPYPGSSPRGPQGQIPPGPGPSNRGPASKPAAAGGAAANASLSPGMDGDRQAAPPPAHEDRYPDQRHPADDDEAFDFAPPPQRPRRAPVRINPSLIRTIAIVVAVLIVGAVAYLQRDAIGGAVNSLVAWFAAPSTTTTAPTTAQPSQPKITDRLGQPDKAGADAPATAQRVVLYEEDPDNPEGRRMVGTATWRTETLPATGGREPEIAVRADVEIPERNMSMTWSLRRNTDPALPASHTIEIMFTMPADSPAGGVQNVPGVLMKQAEQTRGVPLAGLAVKVTPGFFLIGLSSIETDVQRNISLLKERPWFDIPVVYNNNRRAILAMEKGEPGERAFEAAFKAWGQ